MCNDLLPESVHAFLDDVETTTCLPILIIIVICTIQFIVNHVFDIGCIIYQTLQDKSDKCTCLIDTRTSNPRATGNNNIISKIKDMMNNLICPKPPISSPKSSLSGRRASGTNIYQEREWDYCDREFN